MRKKFDICLLGHEEPGLHGGVSVSQGREQGAKGYLSLGESSESDK